MGMSIGQPPYRECKVAAKGRQRDSETAIGAPSQFSIDLGFKLKRPIERQKEMQ